MSRRDEPVALRWARHLEAPRCVELVRETWLDAYAGVYDSGEVEALFAGRLPQEESWAAQRQSIIGTLIADLDGEVAGLAALARLREGSGELVLFYVRPRLQGRGIGSRLWNEATRALRERGCRRLVVWTLERSAARRFYEVRGCVPFGSGTYRLGEHAEPVVGLELSLDTQV